MVLFTSDKSKSETPYFIIQLEVIVVRVAKLLCLSFHAVEASFDRSKIRGQLNPLTHDVRDPAVLRGLFYYKVTE